MSVIRGVDFEVVACVYEGWLPWFRGYCGALFGEGEEGGAFGGGEDVVED